MKRLPLVKIPFKKLSQANLITYANKHRLAIASTPGSTNFPTPPFDATALGTLITDYQLALSAARKGTKTQTDTKDAAKADLITALQGNWNYVNTQLQNNSGSFQTFAQSKSFASTSGFFVTKNSKPAAPFGAPVVRSLFSKAAGQLHIILNTFSKSGKQRTKKIRGTDVYVVFYQTAASGATPAGPWQQFISSTSNIKMTGIAQGTYNVYIQARGASLTSANTSTYTVVVK